MKELRKNLTIEEQKKPYAKYFYQPIAVPNSKLIGILKRGTMDPAKALMPENINDLLNPGYQEVETGYCICPDGTGYVAVNNKFSGVTVEMINWWFAWHALEDMRYMLWFKKGHHGISISKEDRSIILNPTTPMLQKFQGRTHHVLENTGGGVENIQISFLTPENLGMDSLMATTAATVIGGNGVSQLLTGGPKAPAIMVHFVRKVPGGVEMRSRFWLGYQMLDKKPVKLIPDGVRIPTQTPKGLAFHCVEEYSNLAAILPSLYEEMKGKIF